MRITFISLNLVFTALLLGQAIANEPLTITFTVFSGLPDPQITITDTNFQKAINSRMTRYFQYIAMQDSLEQTCPDIPILGYRGMQINNKLLIINGKVKILDPLSLQLGRCFPDPEGEFERMIARAIVKQNPELASLIPDSLYQRKEKYGVFSLLIGMNDTLTIDFSQLVVPQETLGYSHTPKTLFPDLQFIYSPHMSTVPHAFSVIETVSGSKKNILINNQFPGPRSPNFIDSLYMHLSLSSMIPEDDFIILTQEGATVYLYPLGLFIGGIDRWEFFYIYTTGPAFSTAIMRPSPQKLIRRGSLWSQDEKQYDLRGRVSGTTNKSGDNKPNAIFISVKDSEGKTRRHIKVTK